jgi:hAT family C-terminal dimerisation region
MTAEDLAKAIRIVKKKVEKMPTTTSTTTTSSSTPSSSAIPVSKKDNAKQLMNQLAGINVIQSNVRPISVDAELSLFSNVIKTKKNFKQFWCDHRHSFPRLVHLVYRYCIVPATSVASESAFSIAGFIVRKQRSSLSS